MSRRSVEAWARAISVACVLALPAACAGDRAGDRSPTEPAGPAAGGVAGRVLESESGRPLASALVTLLGQADGAEPSTVRSDSRGAYAVDGLPPGTYRMTACSDGHVCGSAVITISRGERAAADFELTPTGAQAGPMPTGAVAGALRLRQGGPAPAGTRVAFHAGDAACGGDAVAEIVAGAGGRFLAPALPAGLYLACARADVGGRGWSGRRGVGVEAGLTTTADLVLDPDAAPLETPVIDGETVVSLGAEFELRFTIVGDGTGVSRDVAVADTLPLLDVAAGPPGPEDRDGNQAFRYVTDRPTFDPDFVRYAIDLGDDGAGTAADLCFVAPVPGFPAAFDTPAARTLCADSLVGFVTIGEARTAAEEASARGDQVVVVEYFDADLLDRTPPAGDLEAEDSFAITVRAIHSVNEFRADDGSIPEVGEENGAWCNIVTATSAANDFVTRLACVRVVAPLLEVRKTALDASVPAGGETRFAIDLGNLGSVAATEVSVDDSLDPGFLVSLTGDPGLVRVDGLCAECSVTFGPDSSALHVSVPAVPPTDTNGNGHFDDEEGFHVADLVVRTPLASGTFCNHVAAVADGLADADLACVVTDLQAELDIANDDGRIEAGAFSDVESFTVGDTIVYQTRVTNRSAAPVTSLSVRWEIAPETGILQLAGVLRADPPEIACDAATDSCSLTLAALAPGASVSLDFQAVAGFEGSDVERMTIAADQLSDPVVNEEPTTVTP